MEHISKNTLLEEARAFFVRDRFATEAAKIVIEDVGEHYAKCSLVIEDIHRNAVGQVMGGVLFTLADFVFAVAANFRQPVTVTCTSQISFLRATKGKALYGEARLLKDGRRNCFYDILITDDLGEEIAIVHASGVHLEG